MRKREIHFAGIARLFGNEPTRVTQGVSGNEEDKTLTAQIEVKPRARDAASASPEAISAAVIESLEDDKAEDILVFDLEGKSTLADQMVIASGRSARHVSALADHVLRTIKDLGGKRSKVEGLRTGDWVLIDTGDLIIHLFRPEVRAFYNLERIWGPEGGPAAVA